MVVAQQTSLIAEPRRLKLRIFIVCLGSMKDAEEVRWSVRSVDVNKEQRHSSAGNAELQ